MLYGPLNCFRIKSYLLPNNYSAIIILFPLQRRDEEPKAVNMLVTVHTVEIESESWLETTHHRTSASNLPEICLPSSSIHLYEGDT